MFNTTDAPPQRRWTRAAATTRRAVFCGEMMLSVYVGSGSDLDLYPSRDGHFELRFDRDEDPRRQEPELRGPRCMIDRDDQLITADSSRICVCRDLLADD